MASISLRPAGRDTAFSDCPVQDVIFTAAGRLVFIYYSASLFSVIASTLVTYPKSDRSAGNSAFGRAARVMDVADV